MHIVYFIHGLENSGGMERVITVKANYLVEHLGYKVTIITLNSSVRTFFTLNDKIHVKTIDYKNKNKIINFVMDLKPDILISTGGKEIGLLPFLPKEVLKIVEVHFCFQYPILREIASNANVFMKLYGLLKLLRYIFLLNFADSVVSLTSSDSNKWRFFLPFSKVERISNPVPEIDHRQFSTNIDGIRRTNNKLIAIGRLDNQKGFSDLIRACEFLVKKYSLLNWSLDIYGEGKLHSKLCSEIITAGLDDRVKILPPVDDLSTVYLNAKALLMTSYYEGMPMVMLEALSFGLPCISFDCASGPSDLIDDSINGYLIKKRDASLFALKVKEIIEMSQDDLNCMRMESLRKVEDYKISNVLASWDFLFKNGLTSYFKDKF